MSVTILGLFQRGFLLKSSFDFGSQNFEKAFFLCHDSYLIDTFRGIPQSRNQKKASKTHFFPRENSTSRGGNSQNNDILRVSPLENNFWGLHFSLDKRLEVFTLVSIGQRTLTTLNGGIRTMAKKKATKKVAKKTTATTTKKAAKPAKKAAAPKKAAGAKRKPNPAFMKALTPSTTLAAVVGATPIPRTEVVKKLWAYIKKHNLQDKTNRRNINADDKLKLLFGKATVNMFEMTKIVSKHLK